MKGRKGNGPPTMTRIHFQFIADVVRALPLVAQGGAHAVDIDIRHMVALEFADALAETSPGFDRARFLAACIGEETPRE